jgi:hypothetical protein
VTLKGKLTKKNGAYFLVSDDGKTYEITSSTVNLDQYVGKVISAAGSIVSSSGGVTVVTVGSVVVETGSKLAGGMLAVVVVGGAAVGTVIGLAAAGTFSGTSASTP